ncbi:Reticulon-domain-containing protein [Exophiala viscosa]|uniref:Reticulon-like protein n=1 Tax=Exophiala viscosa TaxID=2486360 RepID=A0AAN6IJ55_9EURO|nr:Reticulon-domain-containing protein [Exophiala viscosa]
MSSMHYDLNNTSMELPTHTDVSTFDGDTSTGTTGTTGNAPKWDGQQLKDAVTNNAAAAYDTVQNHPITQNVVNHPITQNVVNGPVATSIKNEAGATASEFSDLASSRQQPSYTAANDTPLTHYHSFFYTLLSWKNKRATGVTFATAIVFIFACRYLPILRYLLKITWMTLGVVTLAEASSNALMGSSVAGAVRPRRYYTIPKETLESSLDDLENLINFFVIEGQRIVFAENIPVTAAAFLSAFLTYYLIKLLPFWGMSLLSTCVIFLGPLIYLENKGLIDAQLENASNVIGHQTSQIKDLTAQHTSKGLDTVKQYTGTATAKAQEFVGSARQKIPQPATGTTSTNGSTTGPTGPTGTGKAPFQENDFPSAPKTDLPASSLTSVNEFNEFNQAQTGIPPSAKATYEGVA